LQQGFDCWWLIADVGFGDWRIAEQVGFGDGDVAGGAFLAVIAELITARRENTVPALYGV
jgi:hypothetical protein